MILYLGLEYLFYGDNLNVLVPVLIDIEPLITKSYAVIQIIFKDCLYHPFSLLHIELFLF